VFHGGAGHDLHSAGQSFPQGSAVNRVNGIGRSHFPDIMALHAKTQHCPLTLCHHRHQFTQMAGATLADGIGKQRDAILHCRGDVFDFQIATAVVSL
jgi:hypothetical protein